MAFTKTFVAILLLFALLGAAEAKTMRALRWKKAPHNRSGKKRRLSGSKGSHSYNSYGCGKAGSTKGSNYYESKGSSFDVSGSRSKSGYSKNAYYSGLSKGGLSGEGSSGSKGSSFSKGSFGSKGSSGSKSSSGSKGSSGSSYYGMGYSGDGYGSSKGGKGNNRKLSYNDECGSPDEIVQVAESQEELLLLETVKDEEKVIEDLSAVSQLTLARVPSNDDPKE